MAIEKPAKGSINWIGLVTAVSVLILVGAEAYAVVIAGAWASPGLLEFGEVTDTLYVIGFLGTTAAMYPFAKRVLSVERLRRRTDHATKPEEAMR